MGARPPKDHTTDGSTGRAETQDTDDASRRPGPAGGTGAAYDGAAPAHTPDGLSTEQRECIEALVREAAEKGWRQKTLLRRVHEEVGDSPAADALALRQCAAPLVPGVPHTAAPNQDEGEARLTAAPDQDEGEARLTAAYADCVQRCLVNGRIDRDRLSTEAEGVASAFHQPVDKVRQGIEAACRQAAGTGPDGSPNPDTASRDWTDLPPEAQERIVAAAAAAAQTQGARSRAAVLALARGIAARECPDLRYTSHVGALIADQVQQRRKAAEEAAAKAAAESPAPSRTATPVRSWFALSEEARSRLLAAMEERAGLGAGRSAARLALDEAATAAGLRLSAQAQEAACAAFAQRGREAAAAEDRAARERARPVIDLACAQAADTLRDLLATAEALPEQQRWPNPALQALDAVRDAATVAWQTQPGHAGDPRPPHHMVADILQHPTLAPLVERLEAAFGPRWDKALGGKALRDLLPGCPADIVLDADCLWHVQPDGSVTQMVLADDGQGGKAPREERVLPTVIVPLEQEISLGPWGLPTAGEGTMIGQVYAWWRRHADGAGTWVTGQTQAVTLWDQRRLTTLANEGVPLDSHNAGAGLSWMSYIRDSRTQARRPVFVQPGWHTLPGGTPAFVLGGTILTPSGRADATLATNPGGDVVGWQRGLDAGTRQYLAAYKTTGTADASKDLFRSMVIEYPRIGALAGLAYSALLLPFLRHTGAILDMAGFVLQCAGDSGLGKSTVQRLVVSLAADPRGSEIIGAFSGTAVSIGTKLAASHCLPLCFEEPQQAGFTNHEQSGQTIANVLYMVSQGHDRERGAASGGNRETKHWRSVLYLTGEHSISGLPALEDTGAERRLVDIAPPFTHSGAMEEKIKTVIEPTITQHHGHIVPEVVEKLLRRAAALGGFPALAQEITTWHHEERKAFERSWLHLHPEMGGKAGAEEYAKTLARVGRLSSLVAAGMITLELLLRGCGLSEEQRSKAVEAARQAVIEDNTASLCTPSRQQRYLDTLQEAVVQNTHRIAGLEPRGRDGNALMPSLGYIGGVGRAYGVEVVGILPNALKELMARGLGQYNAREFLAEMEKASVPVADPTDPEGRRTKQAPVLVTPSGERTRRGKAVSLRYRRADGQDIYATHICFRRDALLPQAPNDKA